MHHSSSSWTVRVLPTTAFSEGLIMRNLTTLPTHVRKHLNEENKPAALVNSSDTMNSRQVRIRDGVS
ncbi:hypothetical protein I310_06070 [Cryptococcus deuterogattii CA1014]|nr:hypothetical protein I310_06070 [Cryptococcus deuterogattii CA1014]